MNINMNMSRLDAERVFKATQMNGTGRISFEETVASIVALLGQ